MPLTRSSPPRWSLLGGVLCASAAVALVAAILSVGTIRGWPPGFEAARLQTAAATAHVLVDLPHSRIGERDATWDYFDAVRTRAALLANVMASAPAMEHVARHAGIPAERIAATAPVTANVPSVLTEPGSEDRAREILLTGKRYRLEVQSRQDVPIIDVYAQAPSPAAAERLAEAAIAGLRDYLTAAAIREGMSAEPQARLEEIGRARGGVINGGAAGKIAGLTFFTVFAVCCLLLLALSRMRSRAAPPRPRTAEPRVPITPSPVGARAAPPALSPTMSAFRPPGVPAVAGALPAATAPAPATEPWRLPAAVRDAVTAGGDWPRTTRVLPWMLALFIAVLWLVPFDSIQLAVSLPIDLKFDRLVLPAIVAVWVFALVAGGRGAPRLRITWIHVAVVVFVSLAFLSVVLDARSLNHSLELDTSLKKLPLLLSYLSLFVMLSSVVRRTEVRPFLTYTLGLAVLCALGILVEYRTRYNVFFDVSGKLLPGIFKVAFLQSGYDLGGRRATHGPAAHGLVAVTMLSLALPIALVGLMEARRWGRRLLYALVVCVLIGGMLATQRKTALLAPGAVIVTLAWFRRGELLRMAPIGAVVLVGVLIVSPGTIAPVVDQFRPHQLGADTVSDRTSDYDAIRPDVFTHIALGRGYGSYQPIGHRILDSEVLVRLVEMGVLGLAAFVLLGVSVLGATRAMIGARHPARAPAALMCAAAAAVFLVTATLFDSMSFAQVPYIFLCFAGLAAALVAPTNEDEDAAASS